MNIFLSSPEKGLGALWATGGWGGLGSSKGQAFRGRLGLLAGGD